MKRRELVIKIGGSLIVLPVAVELVGCPKTEPPSEGERTCEETISSNHGHQLEVPAEDLEHGEPRTYELTFGVDHTHTLSLTADHMMKLADGDWVMVESSTEESQELGPHAHLVRVSCT